MVFQDTYGRLRSLLPLCVMGGEAFQGNDNWGRPGCQAFVDTVCTPPRIANGIHFGIGPGTKKSLSFILSMWCLNPKGFHFFSQA